jgi:hypothetical protein
LEFRRTRSRKSSRRSYGITDQRASSVGPLQSEGFSQIVTSIAAPVASRSSDDQSHVHVEVAIKDAFSAARRQMEALAQRASGKVKLHEVEGMRAAIEVLPFTHPKLAVTAQISDSDLATLLDRRLKRMEEAKLIEHQPPPVETKPPIPRLARRI